MKQRTEPLLIAMKQPLLLLLVESSTTYPTKSSIGKDNNDNNIAKVEVCCLVSDSGKNQNSRVYTNTGVIYFVRSKSGKYPKLKNKHWSLMVWKISGAPFRKKNL
ncbi:hypothetical protein AYI69_g2642 [Smittium culicis]|uniref:Uncharacterized protein n=1 Tax=Smittium culicis TaxID=133412 RepID=A0A1R1YLW8_9FUNG|nr:hypothetical protein AYI69_g2642 [Smittium culicis]